MGTFCQRFVEALEVEIACSFILLKPESALYTESPIFLAYELKRLALVKCLIQDLGPLNGGKDVILIHIEELI